MTHMLHPIADELWEYEYWLKMAPGFYFPVRMTVARLDDGSLWLHSPAAINDTLAKELEALGPVMAIVEPNLFHHLHARSAKERYPAATVYGVPGLEKKQKELVFEDVDDAAPSWAKDFEVLHIRGAPMLEERVFFHKTSKTLILTDLVFHMVEVRGFLSHLVLRMVGAYKKLAQSRSIRMLTKDKAAFADGLSTVLQWDFERVSMAHGKIIHDNAKAQLQQAFAWCVPSSNQALLSNPLKPKPGGTHAGVK